MKMCSEETKWKFWFTQTKKNSKNAHLLHTAQKKLAILSPSVGFCENCPYSRWLPSQGANLPDWWRNQGFHLCIIRGVPHPHQEGQLEAQKIAPEKWQLYHVEGLKTWMQQIRSIGTAKLCLPGLNWGDYWTWQACSSINGSIWLWWYPLSKGQCHLLLQFKISNPQISRSPNRPFGNLIGYTWRVCLQKKWEIYKRTSS